MHAWCLLPTLNADRIHHCCCCCPFCSSAIPAVLPLVIERLSHPRESVRKKAVMALLHFHQMDPDRSEPLAGEVLQCYK
jgi:hypothetical protein